MAIKFPEKNYLTFPELMEKWRCTENDIRQVIVEELLKPSFYLRGLTGYFVDMVDSEATSGTAAVKKFRFVDHSGLLPNKELYFYLRNPKQTGHLDCTFEFCSLSSNSSIRVVQDGEESDSDFIAEWCQLDKTIALDEVIKKGVVNNVEIARFEA